jgi:hypothetical protein
MKSGVRTHSVDSVDCVWFTCCALHNWLLEVNGLSEKWDGGVRNLTSNWDGEMGLLDVDGVKIVVPNALARLSSNLDPLIMTLLEWVLAWTLLKRLELA